MNSFDASEDNLDAPRAHPPGAVHAQGASTATATATRRSQKRRQQRTPPPAAAAAATVFGQQQSHSLPAPLRDHHRPSSIMPEGNFIVIPPPIPPANATITHRRRQQSPPVTGGKQFPQHNQKRHSDAGGKNNNTEEGVAVTVQQRLFEHYHLVAYSLVIVTYFLAFCEYLYLRLISLIYTEPIVYRRHCDKHEQEPIIRTELHFASGCAVFLVMSAFQLVCFLLLTVSTKYMELKRTYAHVISIEQRLHYELVFAVKRTMFATLYPTFAIYLMCSAVILCAIFYMVGLRDPIVHVGSRILIHMFDFFVIVYFLAFPVLCVLFHPDIDCRRRLARRLCRCRKAQSSGGGGGHRRRPEEDAGNGKSNSPEAVAPERTETTAVGEDGTSSAIFAGGGVGSSTHGKISARGAAGGTNFHQQHQPIIVPASPTMTTNNYYGSLERWPKGTIIVDGVGAMGDRPEASSNPSTPRSSSHMVVVPRRRDPRYRRLRGSDEWRQRQTPPSAGHNDAPGHHNTIEAALEAKIRRNEAIGVRTPPLPEGNDKKASGQIVHDGDGADDDDSVIC